MPRSMSNRMRGKPGADSLPPRGPFILRALRGRRGQFAGWTICDAADRIVAFVDERDALCEPAPHNRARIDHNGRLILTLLNRWWRARKKAQPDAPSDSSGARKESQ